jgi:hypothetical protein
LCISTKRLKKISGKKATIMDERYFCWQLLWIRVCEDGPARMFDASWSRISISETRSTVHDTHVSNTDISFVRTRI